MKIITLLTILLLLSSCMTKPNYETINGGQRIQQAGSSFVPPTNKAWSIIAQQTYRTMLAMQGENKKETIIISSSMFNIEPHESKASFLSSIKKVRNSEPDTGRFEVIKQSLDIYSERTEICAKFSSSSKDFGAQRDNKYTIYETYGMYCIHPNKPNIGFHIELSRKAPFGNENKLFNSLGEQLIKSVEFIKFKV